MSTPPLFFVSPVLKSREACADPWPPPRSTCFFVPLPLSNVSFVFEPCDWLD
ncbi:MAG TPA: hypothetical protein VFA20_25335 [Myxococcaceae bacterium]|nr:hypothetical protein [Myxococcaceae bacterium]